MGLRKPKSVLDVKPSYGGRKRGGFSGGLGRRIRTMNVLEEAAISKMQSFISSILAIIVLTV
ncbi:unnamed protein product [marine sediment metagenome]|uniref:Uncharacterized protein n=1 Tax=marine sediment metagenome TaxID=412755 RepID=X1K2L5_9ZZZZ